jgi:hypothetical protein
MSGDCEKSQMIESFSDLAFAYDPLDSGVSKGDPHDGPGAALLERHKNIYISID